MSIIRFITSLFILIALSVNGYCASFASSYIKTEAAAVTRNADVLTGAASGNIANAAGTIALSLISANSTSVITYAFGATADGNNRLTIITDANLSTFYGTGAGTDFVVVGTRLPNVSYKYATAWKSTDVLAVKDGGSVTTQTTAPSITTTTLYIGQRASGSQLFGNIKNLRIWNRAFTNAELQTITTP